MDSDELTRAADAVRQALATQRGELLETVRRRAKAGVDAEEVLQQAAEAQAAEAQAAEAQAAEEKRKQKRRVG